jgi:Rnl2 family RNA ligase
MWEVYVFQKWPSIENSYQNKYIDYWFRRFPSLQEANYIITEKLHGSNIQIIVYKDSYQLASRNRILDPSENFYNIWEVVKDYECIIKFIQKTYLKEQYTYVNLYGELIGPGIQKGVEYGSNKQIRFFGLRIDGKLKGFPTILNIFTLYGDRSSLVPIISNRSTLQEAIDFDVEKLTTYINPKEDNIAEGIVIQPISLRYDGQSYFFLKKKAENFKEKNRARKSKPSPCIPSELQELKSSFENYINENRINSVFSKEGIIDDPKDIGKYIKLVMDDVMLDFMKENDISNIGKKYLKIIFKDGGKLIIPYLRREL